jgi:hypothetical protein
MADGYTALFVPVSSYNMPLAYKVITSPLFCQCEINTYENQYSPGALVSPRQ